MSSSSTSTSLVAPRRSFDQVERYLSECKTPVVLVNRTNGQMYLAQPQQLLAWRKKATLEVQHQQNALQAAGALEQLRVSCSRQRD